MGMRCISPRSLLPKLELSNEREWARLALVRLAGVA